MYFETVDWATSKPSFRSSPWICGAPQSGFSKLILRIRSRTSRSEEHTSELQSHRDLHSFPTRRSSDLRLGDVEAELQKLAVDMRRTPERVLEAHSSDKVAHLFVDLRSTTERADFHRQNAAKPLRCQRTIVAGLKIVMASRMRG